MHNISTIVTSQSKMSFYWSDYQANITSVKGVYIFQVPDFLVGGCLNRKRLSQTAGQKNAKIGFDQEFTNVTRLKAIACYEILNDMIHIISPMQPVWNTSQSNNNNNFFRFTFSGCIIWLRFWCKGIYFNKNLCCSEFLILIWNGAWERLLVSTVGRWSISVHPIWLHVCKTNRHWSTHLFIH